MKVTSLELKDVGGIPNLNLEDINSQMNIICGENGVGKTNILDSIASCYSSYNQNVVMRRSGSSVGQIKLERDVGSPIVISLLDFKPSENTHYLSNSYFEDSKTNLLYLKINRSINYKSVRSINADPDSSHRSNNNNAGIQNEDIKDWLLNRILHSAHKGHLTETQLANLEFAKECFSILNPNYIYKRLDTNNEIFLETPTGEIYFEYLSSGFKSIIFILLGIIKEIDYRFENNRISAKDYDGVILIDEIELHLHPEWQGQICSVLKEAFPKAQFFISTHSPHVVQTALKDEVIALERRDNGVVRRTLPTSEYGYQGWTIEEILEDVMGMTDLRTQKYNEVKKRFDEALDSKNKQEAQLAFNELERMLHPNYPLKPVFKIQLDSLGE